jgi:hypothetical protein
MPAIRWRSFAGDVRQEALAEGAERLARLQIPGPGRLIAVQFIDIDQGQE